ncbi:hypothetical protein XI06_01540 [Bradyrhizobium sp. CCBAU 11434]|uniref:hypothetical protein n=1 Tax=Bradyrhizobium sp. CCBAU 11434 TaxID=1630885 RepID=UPI002306BEA0|nr:hypothetical protein [Bradyrhizobium sp. CCBAU 11434]MDA9519062.1 hypothetical protein [Bradyrhizobium sp. CCBAU 11434]
MDTDPGHEIPVDHPQPEQDQCGCGGDTEQKALHEIEEAEAKIAKGQDEVQHGLHDVEEGVHLLDKAKADLKEAQRHHVIHFTVNGEPEKTEQREWTPDDIITKFGEVDPASNYLVRIKGHHKESFQGKGEIPIEIHDCDDFQIVSTGPTPVSDGSKLTGASLFVAGLEALGYKPTLLSGTTDHVVFEYQVPTGKYAGRTFRLGVVVPADFQLSSPGGLHVSPRIHPNKGGKMHPTEGIADSAAFQSKAGGEWHYWSRPVPDWATSKKTVAAYMHHVWWLWDTQ